MVHLLVSFPRNRDNFERTGLFVPVEIRDVRQVGSAHQIV